uniref:Uncharacterized protein n=1 Tax=Lactuca sativa TaxID=4236 RepID=A0A9R1VP91_LACSA|nr:hypothetical protein LSAT_V11C400224200 [Lactuca sativa]
MQAEEGTSNFQTTFTDLGGQEEREIRVLQLQFMSPEIEREQGVKFEHISTPQPADIAKVVGGDAAEVIIHAANRQDRPNTKASWAKAQGSTNLWA